MTEVSKQGTTENSVAQNSRSVTYSIYDLFTKINPKDIDFIKYIPDDLLTKEQLKVKKEYLYKSVKINKEETYRSVISNNVGRDVSEIKLAVDDTITDGMFADGDLFDEDGYIQQSVFERAVKDNPAAHKILCK